MTLRELSEFHGTNKLAHNYEPFYEKYVNPRRNEPLTVLEIGIYEGNSLRMWRDYFPNAHIYGVDIDESCMFDEPRIQTYVASQSDHLAMNAMAETVRPFDIIIDDGSHCMDDQQLTFGYMFKHLAPGGLYFIEDLHTSFFTGNQGKKYGVKEHGTTFEMLSFWKYSNRLYSDHIQYHTQVQIHRCTDHIELCGDTKSGIAVIRKKA